MASKKTTVLDNRCPNCGAKAVFDPKTGKWSCKHCGSELTLEEMKKHKNASSEESNTSVSEENVDTYDEYISYNCPDCGAEIITDAQTSATFCVYCGNTAILKNKLSGKFAPSEIIPFKKTQDDAKEAFRMLTKGRPLVPKSFTDEKNIEKIRGIYIPFWFHDYDIDGRLVFKGNTYEHWSRGDTRYTKTNVYEITREGSLKFTKVPIDGSTRFDNALMNTIQPYDYSELVPYNHAYLSGFLAERYDVEEKDTEEEIEKNVMEVTKNTFLNSASMYSGKVIKENTLAPKEHTFEYALLPVYMVNVKYMGKMYTFAMNGQTGEFIGNIPVNKKKALIITIIMLIGLFLFFLGIFYISYIMGGNK